MKNLRSVPIGCLTVIVALAVPATGPQAPTPVSPRAAAHELADAKAEPGSQYAFLIGDWDVAVTLRRPSQPDLTYQANWHNYWLAEGKIVMRARSLLHTLRGVER